MVILGKLLVDLADSVSYRQNTRLPLVVPITISGEDESGIGFEEGTQTIDVGKQGIRTLTLHRMPANAQVRISNGDLGKDRQARVVWQARTDTPDGRAEIGIEFLESLTPKGMRAIETLPDDWLNDRLHLTASQKLEFFWARMKTYPVSPELKAMVESAKSLSADELNDLTSIEENIGPVEPSREANAAASPSENLPEKKGETNTAGDPNLPQSQADAKRLVSVPPQAPVLTTRGSPQLPKERAKPAAKSHFPQERKEFPVENLTRLAKTLCDQADTISKGVDRALERVREVAEESVAKLRDAQQEIESRLKKVNTEYENRLAELGKSSREEFRKNAETSLSNLREELQRLEARGRELTIEADKQNVQELATKPKVGSADLEASLADFRGQLQQSLNEFRETAAQDLQEQLRRGASSLREISAMEQKELELKSAALQQGNDDYATMQLVHRESDAARPQHKPLGALFIVALCIVVATLVCAFAFFSTQPSWQLQAEPPPEFIDANASRNMQPAEEELAHAYWTCAVNVIQKNYGFGTTLPAQAPPEFAIQPRDAANTHSRAYLDASRERYWQKLKLIWGNPRIWVPIYQWNTDWVFSPLKTLGLKLRG